MLRPALLFGMLLVFGTACGDPPKPMTPDTAMSSDAGPDPDVVGDNPAQPKPRKPFPIHNSCADVVTVVFGDDPKAESADRRRMAANSESQGPRDAEGKATVNLLDGKGEPIATVHITRGMKQLEIGRSCRTLDAR